MCTGELYFGPRRPRPAKAWDRSGLVMHCSSFSKTLAPGFRVGWAAAGRFTADVAQRKLMSSLAAPVPSQEGLSEYLRHGSYDRHLRQLRGLLAQQQHQVLGSIARHFPAGTKVTRPEGGYCAWVELPPSVNALELHRLALSHGVSVAPGQLFSAGSGFTHHMRVNFGHPDNKDFESALRTVGAIAKALV